MLKVALVFPGQGAQKVGMGKEFYEASPQAKAVIDRADKIMGNGLRQVMFEGPVEKLTATAYCQPAILAMSIAAFAALKASDKYKNLQPVFAAGLSLGEYSALAAAEALSLDETLKLVERRATFMEEATKAAKGKMAAIIGLEKERIVEICRQTGAEVANFNSPQQIVITGHADKVEQACVLLKEAGAKTVIPLDVSGAFHSSLMRPAAERFGGELTKAAIQPARFPVVSNVDGKPASDPEAIRKNLGRQITSSVQWVDSIQFMAGQRVTTFFEIGPGKVLSGLIRRINPDLKVFNIEKPEDIEKISETVAA